MTEEAKIKEKLQEVHINGFKWFVDDVARKIYLDRELNGFIGYDFLTPNERTQIYNQLYYDREKQYYANK